MPDFSLLGDKAKDSSAGQMAELFLLDAKAAGFDVLFTSDVSEATQTPLCVNMMMKKARALKGAMRFSKLRKLISWYVQNPANMEPEEVASQLLINLDHRLVVQSEFLQKELDAFMQRYFSLSLIRELRQRMVFLPYGVDDAFTWSETNQRQIFIVPYNRVNEMFKRQSIHTEVTGIVKQQLQLSGFPTQHVFVMAKDMFGTADGTVKALKEPHPYVVRPQPSRESYLNAVKQYGLFFCTSKSESFGIYYLELLFSGVVGAFLEAPWVHTLLPDYPFVFPNKKALAAGLVALFHEYEQARSVLRAYLYPTLREKYRVSRFHAGLLDLIRQELAT